MQTAKYFYAKQVQNCKKKLEHFILIYNKNGKHLFSLKCRERSEAEIIKEASGKSLMLCDWRQNYAWLTDLNPAICLFVTAVLISISISFEYIGIS